MFDTLKLLLFLSTWYILLYVVNKFAEICLWLWKSHNGIIKWPNCKVYYLQHCTQQLFYHTS